MKTFDSWFKKKFRNLYESILCGDMVAANYKKVSKQSYEAGQQSQQGEVDKLQTKVDELQVRIDDAIALLEYNEYVDSPLQAFEVLKGDLK